MYFWEKKVNIQFKLNKNIFLLKYIFRYLYESQKLNKYFNNIKILNKKINKS